MWHERLPGSPALRFWLGLAGCVLLGLSLRMVGLERQVLGGDETHTVTTALTLPVSEILITYRYADNCIPLTAWVRWALDRGATLDEMSLRAIPLLTGGLALLAFPLAWRRHLGWTVALSWAFWLATSPNLVIYSRIVRSYMPVVLFGGGAVMCFYAWWWRGRGWAAVAYVVLATLAGWFHLAASIWVAAPWGFALGSWLARGRRPAGWAIGLVALAVVAGHVAFLWPAWETFVSQVQFKAGLDDRVTPRTVVGMLQLQAGTRVGWIAVLFWAGTLYGWTRWWLDHGHLAGYTATLIGGQVLGIVILAPEGVSNVVALNRYLLLATPFALLGWSFGLAGVARAHPVGPAVAAALGLAVLATGPFADPDWYRSSFTGHHAFVRFHQTPVRVAPDRLPGVYPALLAEADGARIVEAPWSRIWAVNETYPAYQRAHRREVVVAGEDGVLHHPQLAWRNLTTLDPVDLLATDARWLVLHRDPAEEERAIRGASAPEWKVVPQTWVQLADRAAQSAAQLRALWGEPTLQDDRVWVWDLDAIRSAQD